MPDLFVSPKPAPEKSPLPETPPSHSVHHPSSLPTKHNKVGIFSTYTPYPDNVFFSHQDADEELLLILRKHWITNIPWMVIAIIGAILPLITPFLPFSLESLLFISASVMRIVLLLYYLVLFGFILTEFITWFYNVGIITTKRIVDIDFSNLTSKSISAAELENVEDVHASQRGFLQSLFNYGDVVIQTKSGKTNIEYAAIPHPVEVNDIILDLVGKK